MGYLDKDGLSRAFTKLKTLIDKKQDKMKQIGLPSSTTTYKNNWVKFATIDLSSSNAWYACSGTLSFTQGEGGNALGTLKFYCRNGNTAGVIGSSSLIWVSLSDNSYASSVAYVKTANGKYDMYYKPLKDYETPWIALVDCTAYNLFTFSTNSYVASITASNTSFVASHASSASSVPWSGVSGKPSTYTPSSHTHSKSQITDFPTSMPASDVYAWAKKSTKPSYSKSEVGLGNVDNTADAAKSVKYAASAGSAGSVAWANVSGKPSSMPASDVYSWAKQSSKPSYSASEVGAVPTSRTVNGKALSSNISLSAGDVGAAPSSHSHNYAGSSSAGGSANWANGANYSNYTFSNNGVSTSGSGSAYAATVSGFSLATGKSIVMLPNVTSTTTTPTLNVSGTGAKYIRMRLSSSTSSTIPLIRSDFLTQYKPVKVTYDGTYWVIDDFVQPDASNLYGTLISRGSSAPSSGTAGFIYIQTT